MPDDGRRAFWCPRCGTLRTVTGHDTGVHNHDERPKLVDRCRNFRRSLGEITDNLAEWARQHWFQTGIAESIHPPADRQN